MKILVKKTFFKIAVVITMLTAAALSYIQARGTAPPELTIISEAQAYTFACGLAVNSCCTYIGLYGKFYTVTIAKLTY